MTIYLHKAAADLGYDGSFTVEADGQMWQGKDDDRLYLTAQQKQTIEAKALELETDKNNKRKAVLTKLGLTLDEAAALLS